MQFPWHGEASTLDWADAYPLHAAAEASEAETVRTLLASGADTVDSIEPQRGWTPLQYAIASACLKTSAVLIEAGATMHSASLASGEPPCPPLLLALHSGNWSLCTLLLRHLRREGLLSEAGAAVFASTPAPVVAAKQLSNVPLLQPPGALEVQPSDVPPAPAPTAEVPRRVKTGPAAQNAPTRQAARPQAARTLICGPGYVVVGEVAHSALLSSSLFERGRAGVCIVNTLWAKQPAARIEAHVRAGTRALLDAPNLGGQSELSEALSFEVRTCLLLTTCYSQLTACYLLLATHYSLLTSHFSLLTTH